MKCVILSGGPIENYESAVLKTGDMVICADGGTRHAKALGVVPDLIIGDMDSIDPGLLEEFKKKGCRVAEFQREKDEVDTELAIYAALEANADEISILGGTGGRLDHTLANIHLLAIPAERGVRAFMEDHLHRVSLAAPGLPVVVEGHGVAFSLLPLTSCVSGVVTRGARWELDGAEFVTGKPYGVSNMVKADKVLITVDRGMLAVIVILDAF